MARLGWNAFGLAVALASASATSGCERRSPASARSAEVDAAARAYVELTCELSPETATALGRHDRDELLDDRSQIGQARGLAREEAMLADLHARFDAARLSVEARNDVRILEGALAADVLEKRGRSPLIHRPSAYVEPLSALYLMMARDYAPAATRARAVLARLERLPTVIAAARANLGAPPRVSTEIAIEMADGARSFLDDQRAPLVAALPAETARVDAALAIGKDAYAAYAAFLRETVLPRSNGDFAAGAALFDRLLREAYFLEQGHAEVLAVGRRVYEATRAEMDALARKIDPTSSGFPAVLAKLKAHHPSAAGLLGSYRQEVARARAFLEARSVVPFPPGDRCDVVETPSFQRTTVTAAYDQPPAFDASTRGFFFVTPVDEKLSPAEQEATLREHDHGDQVDTSVHEVYPGHHLQLSFARANPSLVRQVTSPSISVEGWALYAEELMSELGYYTDEERMMQLAWTLVRAARVIIDVGLHTGGMTFDQAVKMLVDEVHLERPLALSEVRRYTESPTQPLSYLIGREELRELRAAWKTQEGSAFSLLRFHTEVLTRGAIAPALLRAEMLRVR